MSDVFARTRYELERVGMLVNAALFSLLKALDWKCYDSLFAFESYSFNLGHGV